MAPIVPHWHRPSHPDIQEVVENPAEYTTKSISRVALPPFSVFAKFDFPPCTTASEPTYATVQTGRDTHLNLNSDLLYINHSCEPTLFFDVGNFNVLVGPKGLKPGDELSFFYPSTEWSMAQPFDCLCGTPTCRGRISGARDMTEAQLDGVWLNGHIIQLRAEQQAGRQSQDPTAAILQGVVAHAEQALVAARLAARSYTGSFENGTKRPNGISHKVAPVQHRIAA
uniref:Post-SET domain-containing protein n=1 Tax=Bionectria ochroleuca TaxID=29856 RepID=A0A8H7N2A5_BIOOC